MGKGKISLIILGVVIILGFALVSGLPIPVKIKESGCEVTYQRYLLPRTLCQNATGGHCMTTLFNKSNAEVEMAHCLCDRYLLEGGEELEKQILSKCHRYGNSDVINNDCNDVRFLCEQKEEMFRFLVIE